MKKVYFVCHDAGMHERQSDGVEFCIIPEFADGKIYFYCNEYQMFWRAIEDAGKFDKCCNFKIKSEIKPADLSAICEAGLCKYINSIKEYRVENGLLLSVNCIHL
ncbi:MAG: hypothetical protein KTR20_10025 [Cellvibrionaceae bacterium]|nr:hypothetical protein [Cellvibrionaceae bacterium]